MDTLRELYDFYDSLSEYRKLANDVVSLPIFTKKRRLLALRTELQRGYSRLEESIKKYSETEIYKTDPILGQKRNIFEVALDPISVFEFVEQLDCLNKGIRIVNKVIGKLEAEGKTWEISAMKPRTTRREIKAFIAHEGMTGSLGKIRDFLSTLGIRYLIAEMEASDGRSVEKQVDWTEEQADFAIILATEGKVIDRSTGEPYMGMNVADEFGRARKIFKNRIIMLLQEGVTPHTNVKEIVYETFTTQNMEKAFTKIIKELKNWGFIK